jgi:hypothetical protein
VHQFLVRLLKRDGSAISFAWSATPEGADEGTFFTVGRDITEDQRREDALRQSHKMEAVGQLTEGWRTTSTTCFRRCTETWTLSDVARRIRNAWLVLPRRRRSDYCGSP